MNVAASAHPTAIAVVAEDEPILLIDLADNLREFGFDVIEVTSALEALAALSESPPAGLLVTDVQMPGPMNGFDLAREVAQKWPDMKIVVCSAYLKPQPGQMPEAARFLGKPFSAKLLAALLQDMGATA